MILLNPKHFYIIFFIKSTCKMADNERTNKIPSIMIAISDGQTTCKRSGGTTVMEKNEGSIKYRGIRVDGAFLDYVYETTDCYSYANHRLALYRSEFYSAPLFRTCFESELAGKSRCRMNGSLNIDGYQDTNGEDEPRENVLRELYEPSTRLQRLGDIFAVESS